MKAQIFMVNEDALAALQSILNERVSQDLKWGTQDHDPITWSAILTEEVGEFSQAALQQKFGDGDKGGNLRTEAIHCAAVALAIVECLDRGDWRWKGIGEKIYRILVNGFYANLPKEIAMDDDNLDEFLQTTFDMHGATFQRSEEDHIVTVKVFKKAGEIRKIENPGEENHE